jgi:hypothetical protein
LGRTVRRKEKNERKGLKRKQRKEVDEREEKSL